MNNNRISYILLIITIFIISNSSVFTNIYFKLAFFILLFFLSNKKLVEIKNLKMILLLFLWFVITVVSLYHFGFDLMPLRFVASSLEIILIPYLLVSYIGSTFWRKFEKVVYFFTIISFPIFIIHFLYPNIFNSLVFIFKPITNNTFYTLSESLKSNYYWSSLVYVNASGGDEIVRNSGFMWEPGAFALILIWGIIYNLISNENNRLRIFTYSLALLTTQSTSGYLAFGVLVFIQLLYKRSFMTSVLVLLFVVLIIMLIPKVSFLGPKIQKYYEMYQVENLTYNSYYGAIKVNRFQIVLYDIEKTLRYPFGYGVIKEKDFNDTAIIGVNGLTSLLVMWGIPIFLIICSYIFKYFLLLTTYKQNSNQVKLYTLCFFIVLFSNPIQRNIFIYLILYTVLIDGKAYKEKEYKS